MSHENIQDPDRYSQRAEDRLRLLLLEQERKFWRDMFEAAVSDLASIMDRVEAGERVYFVKSDGTRVDLVQSPSP